jgi:hypothetical protein
VNKSEPAGIGDESYSDKTNARMTEVVFRGVVLTHEFGPEAACPVEA